VRAGQRVENNGQIEGRASGVNCKRRLGRGVAGRRAVSTYADGRTGVWDVFMAYSAQGSGSAACTG
jgi:hypothetical protein